jgi:hypothetical protein
MMKKARIYHPCRILVEIHKSNKDRSISDALPGLNFVKPNITKLDPEILY